MGSTTPVVPLFIPPIVGGRILIVFEATVAVDCVVVLGLDPDVV